MGYRCGSKVSFVLFLLTTVGIGCATTNNQQKKEYSSREKARMFVEIANGALVEGDPTGALQNLARAELLASDLPELHHSKAIAYQSKHDLKSAVLAARRAVELKPDYSDANNTLGKLLLDKGDYSEASNYLNKAATDPLYRESYKAWTNLGILKYETRQESEAVSFFNNAIQDAPNMACVAYYYKGNIALRNNQTNEAIENYATATKKLCARFGEAQLALGLAYQQSHQYELARKTFLEVRSRHPDTKLAEQALEQLKYLP